MKRSWLRQCPEDQRPFPSGSLFLGPQVQPLDRPRRRLSFDAAPAFLDPALEPLLRLFHKDRPVSSRGSYQPWPELAIP